MDRSVLDVDNPGNAPSSGSSSILRWALILLIIIIIFGGGYWYYQKYIVSGNVQPTPTIEVTEAIWKTKSEKVVTDYINDWIATRQNSSEADQKALKARDLLTISAQAKLLTYLDDKNQPLPIASQLNRLADVGSTPGSFKIIASKKIDEKTVEVTVSLTVSGQSTSKIFTVISENNIWLIDGIKDAIISNVSPSPTPSPSASPSLISSPTPSVQPSNK